MPTRNEIQKLKSSAEKMAKGAGDILARYFHKAKIVKSKSDIHDVATQADLASEKFITDFLHKFYPSHNILAEESGDHHQTSDFTWVIDPLDGTKEYIRGLPMFNVSIALEYKGELIVGVTNRVASNEFYIAGRGLAAFANGRKISVSKESELASSFVGYSIAHYKNSKSDVDRAIKLLKLLIEKTYRVRPNPECLACLSWVGLGAYEGYILPITGPHWWDVASGIAIVQEAGGKVTDLSGKPLVGRDISKGILASNGKIHEELLKVINS